MRADGDKSVCVCVCECERGNEWTDVGVDVNAFSQWLIITHFVLFFLFCVFVIFLPHFFLFLLYAYFYELIILMNARLAGRRSRSRSRNVPQ